MEKGKRVFDSGNTGSVIVFFNYFFILHLQIIALGFKNKLFIKHEQLYVLQLYT